MAFVCKFQANKEQIFYTILPSSDPDGHFEVDKSGSVKLVKALDREKTSFHHVLILAVDSGNPPRTATASLELTVKDINDNPPYIKQPDRVSLRENSEPRHLADLVMSDLDDWSLGNGPPFRIGMDSNASRNITRAFSVQYDEGICFNNVSLIWSPGISPRHIIKTNALLS